MPKLPDTVTGARVLGGRMLAIHKNSNPDGRMPLLDHLRELRSRVIRALLAILAGTVVGLLPWVYDRLWRFIDHPFARASAALCQAHYHHRCTGLTNSLIVSGIFDPLSIRIEI